MEAIYSRQSVDKKDSVSIETQISLCRRHATGEVLVFQDKGFSGKNTNRPGFRRLMDAVEAGQVRKIIVYRLDRFSRSIADFGQIWDKLDRRGVEFQSVTENFDTSSPLGRAMLNIVLVFAQLERETIAERVKDNYAHRVALGAWPGGPAPYGFSLTKITDAAGRRVSSLTANEHAATVRQIFSLYSHADMSLRTLAGALNAQGIHGPRRETWDSVSVSRILHSPLYVQADESVYWFLTSKGLRPIQPVEAFDGIHGCNVIGRRDRARGVYQEPGQQQFSLTNHSGFIPSDLWLACQKKLAENKQISAGAQGKNSWLTGRLKCGCCGYAVKVNRDGGRRYFICSGRSNLSVCRQTIRVDPDELEQAIAQQLRTLLDSCPPEAVHGQDPDTARQLQQLEEQIQRLVDALAQSGAAATAYISARIEGLHLQREGLLRRTPCGGGRGLSFRQATYREQKLIAAVFIDRILLREEEAEVIWRF